MSEDAQDLPSPAVPKSDAGKKISGTSFYDRDQYDEDHSRE